MSQSFSNVNLTHQGQTKSLREWARDTGIPYETLRMRLSRGESDPAKLLRKPRGYFRESEAAPRVSTASLVDDLFPPAIAAKLREAARQSGLSPIEVIQKLVTKRLVALLPDTPQVNT